MSSDSLLFHWLSSSRLVTFTRTMLGTQQPFAHFENHLLAAGDLMGSLAGRAMQALSFSWSWQATLVARAWDDRHGKAH